MPTAAAVSIKLPPSNTNIAKSSRGKYSVGTVKNPIKDVRGFGLRCVCSVMSARRRGKVPPLEMNIGLSSKGFSGDSNNTAAHINALMSTIIFAHK
eukprot:109135-Prorocentrum_minimum.AAC.1